MKLELKLNKKYKVNEVAHLLKVGMKVERNTEISVIVGIIREIINEKIYIHQNTHNGAFGDIKPSGQEKYSWGVYNSGEGTIEILEFNTEQKIETMKEEFTKQINEAEFRQLPADAEYYWESKKNKTIHGVDKIINMINDTVSWGFLKTPYDNYIGGIGRIGIEVVFENFNIYIKQTSEMKKEIKEGSELKVLNKNTKKENTIKLVKKIDNILLYKGGWYDMDSIEILSIDGKSLKDDIQSYWKKFRKNKCDKHYSSNYGCSRKCILNGFYCGTEYNAHEITTMLKLEFYKFIEKEIRTEKYVEYIKQENGTKNVTVFNLCDKDMTKLVEIIGVEELNNFFKQYLGIE